MKVALFCLLAGVLPAAGETRGAPSALITLYTSFQFAPPAPVMEAMQEEVGSIMAGAGLVLEWRDLSGPRNQAPSAELAVVTFHGHCDVAGLVGLPEAGGALGWTHVSDGEILPFTDVSCDRLRDFVRRSLAAFNPVERSEVFGRALGRVLAHELYHIFANTAKHARWGVAKECYTVHDLLDGGIQFQEKETRLLRSNRPPLLTDHPRESARPAGRSGL